MSEYDLSTGSNSIKTETKSETEGVDYITFKGEKVHDFIECSDGKKVPRIDERLEEGERYAFANMIAWKLGGPVGNSDPTSAVRKTDDDRFPNKAIGQTDEDPTPSLEDAFSPAHYWYRKLGAGRSDDDPKKVAQSEYHEAVKDATGLELNLTIYKRNFPVRHIPGTDEEMVTIEESPEDKGEWENIQVPAEWETEYGGIPPVVDEEPEPEPENDPDDGDTLQIPDDFGDGMNKGETIHALLSEFEQLRNAPRKVCVQVLMAESKASKSYANTKYNEYMSDGTVEMSIPAEKEAAVREMLE